MGDESATVVGSGGETERVLAWSVEDPGTGTVGADFSTLPDRRPLPRTLVALLAGVTVCGIGLGGFVIGEDQVAGPTVHAHAAIQPPSPGHGLGDLRGVPSPAPKPAPAAKAVPPAPPPPKPAPPKPAPQPLAIPPVRHEIPPAPQAQVAPPAPAPAPTPPPGALEQFSNTLAQQGMHFNEPPETEASEAESMCQDLANGGSSQSWITATERKSTNMPPGGAAEAVHDAIDAYCPQYDDR